MDNLVEEGINSPPNNEESSQNQLSKQTSTDPEYQKQLSTDLSDTNIPSSDTDQVQTSSDSSGSTDKSDLKHPIVSSDMPNDWALASELSDMNSKLHTVEETIQSSHASDYISLVDLKSSFSFGFAECSE